MPIRSLNLHHTHHTALFDALTQLVRDFAALAADSDPRPLLELDLRLAQGCMTSFQFSIGRSGALACSLLVMRQDGHIYEFMNIDAPPTDKPFSFVTPAGGI